MKNPIKKILYKTLLRNNKYYSRSQYYGKSIVLYDRIENLCQLFTEKRGRIKTNKNILLNSKIIFGSTEKQIKKKLGKPVYFINKSIKLLDFRILNYRMYLGGYKTKQEVHLFDNKLFYFNFIFSYVNEEDKQIIKDILHKKYLSAKEELNNNMITDNYGNTIFITDNINFTINYLTGDNSFLEIFNTLKSKIIICAEKEKEKKEEELLIKL